MPKCEFFVFQIVMEARKQVINWVKTFWCIGFDRGRCLGATSAFSIWGHYQQFQALSEKQVEELTRLEEGLQAKVDTAIANAN